MKKIFTKEVIIGFCVISAIAILIIGIEFLKGVNIFKPANYYVARYDNVAGLETAAPVTIEGFKLGQVSEINFNYEHPGEIEVILGLNKNLHVPVDSRAVIGSTLLSGSYVEIELGKSTQMIELGGEIPTAVMPDLMSSISDNLLPSVTGVLPKVDSLLISVNSLASDPALVQSIKNLEKITGNLDMASQNINSLISGSLPSLLNNANLSAANLEIITKDLTELSSQLKSLPLMATMNNVNEITKNLNEATNQLNSPNSTVGQLLTNPDLYNKITKLTSDIDSLVLDIQKNPKKYISIKLL